MATTVGRYGDLTVRNWSQLAVAKLFRLALKGLANMPIKQSVRLVTQLIADISRCEVLVDK